jgi:hypothetical protein
MNVLASKGNAATVYAVTTNTALISFDTSTPETIDTVPISGLQVTETVYGIDFRPSTGELYALVGTPVTSATAVKIFTINIETGAASAVSVLDTVLTGTRFGFGFNPVADKIRVTTDEEENVRFDPDNGTILSIDTPLSPPGNIVEIAYDRSFPGTSATTLLGIDSFNDTLVTIGGIDGVPSPNTGAVTNIGPVDALDFDENSALDFSSFLYAVLRVGGTSQFYRIDPLTATPTLVGNVGTNPLITGGMAVAAEPLAVSKLKIKLNFAKPLKDSISVSGLIPVPAGFSVAGKELVISVGGTTKTVTLDAKGKSKVGFDTVKLTVKSKKGVVAAQDAKFKFTFKKGNFAVDLADEGLVNSTVFDVPVDVLVSLQFNGELRQNLVPLTYKAKTGKTGSAK